MKVKLIMSLVLMGVLMGCSAQGKKALFEKESDTLTVSHCAACKEKPFYINGQWIQ